MYTNIIIIVCEWESNRYSGGAQKHNKRLEKNSRCPSKIAGRPLDYYQSITTH